MEALNKLEYASLKTLIEAFQVRYFNMVAILMCTKEFGPRKSPVDIPPSFFCPITGLVMFEPAMTVDGATCAYHPVGYVVLTVTLTDERQAIEKWLHSHHTSPLTNVTLTDKRLFPNRVMKETIHAYLQQVSLLALPFIHTQFTFQHKRLLFSEDLFLSTASRDELERSLSTRDFKTVESLLNNTRCAQLWPRVADHALQIRQPELTSAVLRSFFQLMKR